MGDCFCGSGVVSEALIGGSGGATKESIGWATASSPTSATTASEAPVLHRTVVIAVFETRSDGRQSQYAHDGSTVLVSTYARMRTPKWRSMVKQELW